MQRHDAFLRSARQGVRSAENMIRIAYGMNSEPRVLVAAASRILSSLKDTVSAILWYELKRGRIPPWQPGFDQELAIFKARLSRRYRMKDDYASLVKQVKELVDGHRESPMEFARHGNLVIMDEMSRYTVVSPELVGRHLEKAKIFIQEAEALCIND